MNTPTAAAIKPPFMIMFGKKVKLRFMKYRNDTIAIEAERNGQPFLTCTVNWEDNWQGVRPYADEFVFPSVVIKNYSENEGMINELNNAGVIIPGGVYLSGSGGTVEVRCLSEEWGAIAKKQLDKIK